MQLTPAATAAADGKTKAVENMDDRHSKETDLGHDRRP